MLVLIGSMSAAIFLLIAAPFVVAISPWLLYKALN